MTFLDVCTTYTVTTVLVVPIFEDCMPGAKHIQTKHQYPLLLIADHHGFKNAYLGLNKLDSRHCYFLFDRNKVMDPLRREVDTLFYSMNEYLMACSQFIEIAYESDSEVLYKLEIPSLFNDDVDLIIDNKYSKVSKTYRKAIRVKQEWIPSAEDDLVTYILTRDIPANISRKTGLLRRHIKRTVADPGGENELFKLFVTDQEIFKT